MEEDAPGEGAAPAAGDAVRTMVANAFQGAIASASSNNNGVAEAANVEGEGGAAEGQQQHQIRVTRDMHQALFLVNNLLVGMPDDNPSFLMQMNPDSFEEDLCAPSPTHCAGIVFLLCVHALYRTSGECVQMQQ